MTNKQTDREYEMAHIVYNEVADGIFRVEKDHFHIHGNDKFASNRMIIEMLNSELHVYVAGVYGNIANFNA